MQLASPSDDFPAPPAIAFTAPDGWVPIVSPSASIAVADPDSPEGFGSNMVVIVSKVIHDHSAEEVARLLLEKTEADYPGATVLTSAAAEVAGLPASVATVSFQPSDAPFPVAQVQGVVMVATTQDDTRYAIQFHGTCARDVLDRYEPVFRGCFTSLTLP